MKNDAKSAWAGRTGIGISNTVWPDCGASSRAADAYECWIGGFLGDYLGGSWPAIPGYVWDHALPPSSFDSTANAWLAAGRSSHPSQSMSMPDYGSIRAYASDGTFTITYHPQVLAWMGYVCDYILYLARMAHDYARDYTTHTTSASERDALRDKAMELGRYALRIIADRGRVQIHEFGHVWRGTGGHCSKGSCCFELAARRWLCAVTSQLGLPLFTGSASAADTWTERLDAFDSHYCASPIPGSEPGSAVLFVPPQVLCWLEKPGVPDGGGVFVCSDCDGSAAVGERWT